MNIIARMDGLDTPVLDGSINWQMDAVSSFSFTIPSKYIDYSNARNSNVKIIENGVTLITGYIDKRPTLSMDGDGNTTVSIECVGELGRLTKHKANSIGHFQNTAVTTIIINLLGSLTSEWELSINTMIDPTITTTIDLRGKETLFSQIIETIKSVPDVHLRYGGINEDTNKHILDIGNFNIVNHYGFESSNLFDLKWNPNSNEVIEKVESYGEIAADNRVTLFNALADSRLKDHVDYADYPILEDTDGTYYVQNLNATGGSSKRKKFDMIKTKNDEVPTVEEVAQAGYALYLKTLRFLKQNQEHDSYSFTFYSGAVPEIGDKIHIRSYIREPIFDAFGNVIDYIKTFEVNDAYRIVSLSHSLGEMKLFDENLLYSFEIEVTTNDEAEQIDPDLELYERLESYDEFDTSEGNPIEYGPILTTSTTHDDSDAADCMSAGSGPTDGKEFVVSSPAVPPGATSVDTLYAVEPVDAVVSEIVLPASPGNDWTACVKYINHLWPPPANESVKITVFWQFS